MTEKLDERVGYMTISVLMSILTEYVKSKIVNGKYTGDLNYLIFLGNFDNYLRN